MAQTGNFAKDSQQGELVVTVGFRLVYDSGGCSLSITVFSVPTLAEKGFGWVVLIFLVWG